MSESILAVLDRESIRLIDGRYSTGFANMKDLQKLIDMGGYVEVYDNQGMKFVRKHIVPATQQSVQADVCWSCNKPWSQHRQNRVGHEVCP